jgi:integrase/recombinase XerD
MNETPWNRWRERFVLYLHTRNFSEKSIKDYSGSITFFFRFLADQGVETLSVVTRDLIHAYQTHLYYLERKGKKLSFGTQHRRLSVVKTFFRFCAREEYLPYDPAADIELPKRARLLPRGIMTMREIRDLLGAPRGDAPLVLRDRAILELLYSTGVRNAELRALTLFDVDCSGGQLRIRYGKGKKERLVPLGDCAQASLERYLKKGRPHLACGPSCTLLFVSVHGNQLSSSNLVWIVRKYLKKTKITKDITPHCFRHTCASHMLKGKADLRHIQELLGHASVQTTQIYTKVELSNLKEVHKKCHPREKMGSSS